jgi:hypothetical protein
VVWLREALGDDLTNRDTPGETLGGPLGKVAGKAMKAVGSVLGNS